MHDWDETWWAYWLYVAASIEIHVGMVRYASVAGRIGSANKTQICACAPAWKSILQEPIKALSSKISSKLSSLRSPSHSPDSSRSAKPGIFNPLRSLPWFLHTRFDFERTQRGPSDQELRHLEQKLNPSSSATETLPSKGLPTMSLRHSKAVDDTKTASGPDMRITMRQSIEQSSTHLHEGSVSPSEWLSESPQGSPATR